MAPFVAMVEARAGNQCALAYLSAARSLYLAQQIPNELERTERVLQVWRAKEALSDRAARTGSNEQRWQRLIMNLRLRGELAQRGYNHDEIDEAFALVESLRHLANAPLRGCSRQSQLSRAGEDAAKDRGTRRRQARARSRRRRLARAPCHCPRGGAAPGERGDQERLKRELVPSPVRVARVPGGSEPPRAVECERSFDGCGRELDQGRKKKQLETSGGAHRSADWPKIMIGPTTSPPGSGSGGRELCVLLEKLGRDPGDRAAGIEYDDAVAAMREGVEARRVPDPPEAAHLSFSWRPVVADTLQPEDLDAMQVTCPWIRWGALTHRPSFPLATFAANQRRLRTCSTGSVRRSASPLSTGRLLRAVGKSAEIVDTDPDGCRDKGYGRWHWNLHRRLRRDPCAWVPSRHPVPQRCGGLRRIRISQAQRRIVGHLVGEKSGSKPALPKQRRPGGHDARRPRPAPHEHLPHSG